ncbi:hypothetical protein LTR56_006730 [Elasticomyces elasticus]|nr:hypothetical protein LTR22_017741 [Elasticomyces elasticus]KAK3649831.1 hypothetical protein LTR56_006730 [Elasticomyces elasticus]KAK4913099.1 hypothetical protein LTR49_018565 [Elasticomyces elasticus]KAK5762523.1 hypothetical protein LTS12_007314 [Elasticomyces elasticus]
MSDAQNRKKPQRVQLACLPCRQAKLKCNRDTPACDQCVRRLREADCTYTERGLRYNAAKQKAEFMREKVDRLESFVNQLKSTAPTKHNTQIPSVEHSLAHATGKLRLTDTGGVHFVGPSHWESIIEDIAEVKAYFDLQGSPEYVVDDDSPPLQDSHIIAADIQFGTANIYRKEDLLALLPAKSVVDRLVATWFRSSDGLRLILHAPTFQVEYQQFWQAPAVVSPAWLALLVSVASVGAELLASNQHDANMGPLAEDLRRMTTHALILAEYVKPQPHVIESLMHHIKSLLVKSGDVTSELYVLLGNVSRLCTQGGYHRDPSHNPNISPLCAEMRRRIWDAVCAYDIKMCYQLGLVSVVNLLTQDTAPSSNYTDEDLLCDPIPPPRPLRDQTPMTWSVVYSKISHVLGDIIYCSHTPNNPDTAEVARLDADLQRVRDELPPQLRMRSLEESFLDAPELRAGRYGLEFVHLKALCVLYQRYLSLPGHTTERIRCVEAATALVEHQVVLLQATQDGGELSTSLPFVRAFIHDFNLAAMLLCSHANRQKTSATEDESDDDSTAVLPLILRVCRLWEQCGVNSIKARHALRAIQRFVEQRVVPPESRADRAHEHDALWQPTMANAEIRIPGSTPSGLHDVVNETHQEAIPDFPSFTGPSADQDMLFQELFGPGYFAQGGSTSDWS